MRFKSLCGLVAFMAVSACAHKTGAPAATGPASEVERMLNAEPLGRASTEPLTPRRAVPDSFPKLLLPAGGSVAAVGVAADRTVVVTAIPATMPFDSVQFVWRLQDAGWTLRMSPVRGFVSSNSTVAPGTTLCKDEDFITVSHRTLPSGERLVRSAITRDPSRSCAPASNPFTDLPLPIFELPPTVRSGLPPGNVGSVLTSRVRLETTLTPQALGDLLVPQMTAVGWTVRERPAAERALAVTRLAAKSRTGDPLTALLIFTTLEPEVSVQAVLYVVRDKAGTPPPRALPPVNRTPRTVAAEAAEMMRLSVARPTDEFEARSTLPESFPKELIYPNSEVISVGATSTATSVVSLVGANAPFDPVRNEWTFADRGWIVLQPLRFGFVIPGYSAPTHCRGSEYATTSYRTLESGEHLALVSVTSDPPQRRPCAAQSARAMDDVPTPRIELPNEVRRSGGAGSGGSFDMGTHTRLTTTLPVEALTALSLPQVQASGWVRETQVTTPGSTAISRFVTTSRSGQPATALLAYSSVGDAGGVEALILVSLNSVPPIR